MNYLVLVVIAVVAVGSDQIHPLVAYHSAAADFAVGFAAVGSVDPDQTPQTDSNCFAVGAADSVRGHQKHPGSVVAAVGSDPDRQTGYSAAVGSAECFAPSRQTHLSAVAAVDFDQDRRIDCSAVVCQRDLHLSVSEPLRLQTGLRPLVGSGLTCCRTF